MERAPTHILLEPLDFRARLAALVPPPRVHWTRYHGVFAPHAALRAAITPAGRGQGAHRHATATERATPRHVAMNWAQRLKRVFAIDLAHCRRCGGRLQVIASIEDPALIQRILAHLQQPAAHQPPRSALGPRAATRKRGVSGRRAKKSSPAWLPKTLTPALATAAPNRPLAASRLRACGEPFCKYYPHRGHRRSRPIGWISGVAENL